MNFIETAFRQKSRLKAYCLMALSQFLSALDASFGNLLYTCNTIYSGKEFTIFDSSVLLLSLEMQFSSSSAMKTFSRI